MFVYVFFFVCVYVFVFTCVHTCMCVIMCVRTCTLTTFVCLWIHVQMYAKLTNILDLVYTFKFRFMCIREDLISNKMKHTLGPWQPMS